METSLYIIHDIDPFDINTLLVDVKEVFNQLTYSHIPVTKDGVFMGCVSETDAHCFDIQKAFLIIPMLLSHFTLGRTQTGLTLLRPLQSKQVTLCLF